MNQLTEVEKAYLAGFFDGEGCISIVARMDKKKAKTPSYQVDVVIGQRDIRTLHDLQQMTGIGKVYENAGGRGCASWRITHIQTRDFLSVLLPYLRNKKQEAVLAIEFVDTFNRSTRDSSQDTTAEKECYRQELHRLKGTSGATRGRPRL
jgi:hypothetical protein